MLYHWSPAAVITEYRKYAGAKARLLDEIFISQFDVPGMLALLKTPGGGAATAGTLLAGKGGMAGTGSVASGTGSGNPMAVVMLPTPPASDIDGVEDDAWTLHVGI